jgi:hypothetical protein
MGPFPGVVEKSRFRLFTSANGYTGAARHAGSRRSADLPFRIKLDFGRNKHECPQLSLLLWCLSVPKLRGRFPSPAKSDVESDANDSHSRKSPYR